jgi:hypothetical protein
MLLHATSCVYAVLNFEHLLGVLYFIVRCCTGQSSRGGSYAVWYQ